MLAFPMQPALLGGAHYKKRETPRSNRVFLKVTLVVVFLFILVNLVNDSLHLQWYKHQDRILLASSGPTIKRTTVTSNQNDHAILTQETTTETRQSRRRLRDKHNFPRPGHITTDQRPDTTTTTTTTTTSILTTTNNDKDPRLAGRPNNGNWVCSLWEESLDDFWQSHPDYEPILDNETHTCFAPIPDPARVDFLCKLHRLQFPSTNHPPNNDNSDDGDTSTSTTRSSISRSRSSICQHVGFSSPRHSGIESVDDFVDELVAKLGEELYASFRQQRPFQIHRQITDMNCDTRNQKKDPFCLFLPISNCTTTTTTVEQQQQSHHASSLDKPTKRRRNSKDSWIKGRTMDDASTTAVEQQQRRWIMDYLLRPRQHVRREVYKLIQEQSTDFTTLLGPSSSSCTWIHVRGKAVIPASTLGFLSDTPLFGKR